MRRWLALLLLLSWLAWPATRLLATTFDFTLGGRYPSPGSSIKFTVSTSAVGITHCGTGLFSQPALVQVLGQGILFIVDGPSTYATADATPTVTDFSAVATDVIMLTRAGLFRAIRSGGSDATLKVQCLQR